MLKENNSTQQSTWAWGLFLNGPGNLTGLQICSVFIQDGGFNSYKESIS